MKDYVQKLASILPLNKKKVSSFRAAYEENLWGDKFSRSGTGSNLSQTEAIRLAIPILCKKLNIKTMLDIPCGDYFWMKEIRTSLEDVLEWYLGADIVRELIENNIRHYRTNKTNFILLNMITDRIPKVDLIFNRDCFIHFPQIDILRALRNYKKSGSRYLLTNTYPQHPKNEYLFNVKIDGRTINLEQTPFLFPKPIELINENCKESNGRYGDKSLGLWEIADIPFRRMQTRILFETINSISQRLINHFMKVKNKSEK